MSDDDKVMTEMENPNPRQADPLTDILEILSTASDGMLATPLAKECQGFIKAEHTQEEKIRFLRDLRDKSVYYGGASNLVMSVFSVVLDKYPEALADRDARHVELEKGMRR
jgi:hypothetical protein